MSESKQLKKIIQRNGKNLYIYPCGECGQDVEMSEPITTEVVCDKCSAPDYGSECDVCGATPVVPQTGMCGPCSFGDADTAGGNW